MNGRVAPRQRVLARLSVSCRAGAVAGEGAVGRRTQPAAARPAVHAPGQPAGPRRTDQRPRPRDARAPRSAARRVAGNAAARQPRSRVSRQRRHQHVRVRRRRPGRRNTSAATRTGCGSARRSPRRPRRCRAEPVSTFPRPRRTSRRNCRIGSGASSTSCLPASRRSRPNSGRLARPSRIRISTDNPPV